MGSLLVRQPPAPGALGAGRRPHPSALAHPPGSGQDSPRALALLAVVGSGSQVFVLSTLTVSSSQALRLFLKRTIA